MGEILAKSDAEVRETERESRMGDVQRAPSQSVERLARTAIRQLLNAALNRSQTRHHPSHGALALSQPAAAEATMLLYAGMQCYGRH